MPLAQRLTLSAPRRFNNPSIRPGVAKWLNPWRRMVKGTGLVSTTALKTADCRSVANLINVLHPLAASNQIKFAAVFGRKLSPNNGTNAYVLYGEGGLNQGHGTVTNAAQWLDEGLFSNATSQYYASFPFTTPLNYSDKFWIFCRVKVNALTGWRTLFAFHQTGVTDWSGGGAFNACTYGSTPDRIRFMRNAGAAYYVDAMNTSWLTLAGNGWLRFVVAVDAATLRAASLNQRDTAVSCSTVGNNTTHTVNTLLLGAMQDAAQAGLNFGNHTFSSFIIATGNINPVMEKRILNNLL